MKIAHISDVHLRLASRSEEYEHVFSNLKKDLERTQPNLIVLAGDLFHNKVNLSPEAYTMATRFMDYITSICPVVLFAGNHDANLSSNRQDAISPLVELYNRGQNDEIKYLRNTGIYEYGGFRFFLNSVLDKLSPETTKVYTDSKPNIFLYHGAVAGAKTNDGFEFQEGKVSIDYSKYDATMLGDIHKFQYLNDEKTVAYSSSLICQDHGEHPFNHGYILWTFENGNVDSEFIRIHNDYTHVSCVFSNEQFIFSDGIEEFLNTSTNAQVRILTTHEDYQRKDEVIQIFKEKFKIRTTPSVVKIKSKSGEEELKIKEDIIDLTKKEIQLKAFNEYFKNDKDKEALIQLHEKVYDSTVEKFKRDSIRNVFTPSSLEFSNLFVYGEDNYFNFSEIKGQIAGIFAPNSAGKSSFLDIICFAIYGSTPTTSSYDEILNYFKDDYRSFIEIPFDGGKITIERTGRRTTKTFKNNVEWNLYDSFGNLMETDGDSKGVKDKVLEFFGDVKSFSKTSYIYQKSNEGFLTLNPTPRLQWLYKESGIDCFEIMNDFAKRDSKNDREDYTFHAKQNYKEDLVDVSERNRDSINKLNKKKKEYEKLESEKLELEEGVELVKEEIKPTSHFDFSSTDTKDSFESDIVVAQTKLKESKDTLLKNLEDYEVEQHTKKDSKKEKLGQIKSKRFEDEQEYISLFDSKNKKEVELQQKQEKLSPLKSLLDEISSEYEALENKKRDNDVLAKEIEALNRQLVVLQSQKTSLEKDIKSSESNTEILEKDQRFLKEDLCKTCPLLENAFSAKQKAKEYHSQLETKVEEINKLKDLIFTKEQEVGETLQKLLYEKIAEKNEVEKSQLSLQERINSLEGQIQDINISIEKFPEKFEKSKSSEIKLIEMTIEQIDEKIKNEKQTVLSKIENLEERCKIHIEKLNDKISKFDEYEKIIQENKEYEKLLQQTNEMKAEVVRQMVEVRNELTVFEKEVAVYDNKIDELTRNIKIMETAYDVIRIYDKYIEATSKTAIPLLLIDNILSAVNNEINAVLEKVTDYMLHLKIEDEALECYIENEKGVRKATRLAGMEGFMADLAFRIGISSIGNTPMAKFLITDEGFSALDSERRQNIPQLCSFLKEIYDFIIIVDHNEMVKDYVDKTITIEVNEKESFINSSNLI